MSKTNTARKCQAVNPNACTDPQCPELRGKNVVDKFMIKRQRKENLRFEKHLEEQTKKNTEANKRRQKHNERIDEDIKSGKIAGEWGTYVGSGEKVFIPDNENLRDTWGFEPNTVVVDNDGTEPWRRMSNEDVKKLIDEKEAKEK
jgi:hypothetical protein